MQIGMLGGTSACRFKLFMRILIQLIFSSNQRSKLKFFAPKKILVNKKYKIF